MNITTIKAAATSLSGTRENEKRRVPDRLGALGIKRPDGAGKFDTFTMTGVHSEDNGEVKKAHDENQAALIRGLSTMSEEEKALAAIDAYRGLQKELGGRIRSLESSIEYFKETKSELDFCQKALENGGRAAYGAKLSFGSFSEGDKINEEFLKSSISKLQRSIDLQVKAYDKNAVFDNGQRSLNSRIESHTDAVLCGLADIYNAVTGGGGAGVGNYEESGCFDRYIDGISADNFVSKLSDKIGKLKEYSDNLSKSFHSYLDKNKTAEKVFKKYSQITEMRRELFEKYDKVHEYAKQIKDNLGINEMLDEL